LPISTYTICGQSGFGGFCIWHKQNAGLTTRPHLRVYKWTHIYILSVYINLVRFYQICGTLQATQITISLTCVQSDPKREYVIGMFLPHTHKISGKNIAKLVHCPGRVLIISRVQGVLPAASCV